MTGRQYLIAAGEALYGERYQTALARGLRTSRQHLMRLLDGSREVQEHHVERATALLRERGKTIADLLRAA